MQKRNERGHDVSALGWTFRCHGIRTQLSLDLTSNALWKALGFFGYAVGLKRLHGSTVRLGLACFDLPNLAAKTQGIDDFLTKRFPYAPYVAENYRSSAEKTMRSMRRIFQRTALKRPNKKHLRWYVGKHGGHSTAFPGFPWGGWRSGSPKRDPKGPSFFLNIIALKMVKWRFTSYQFVIVVCIFVFVMNILTLEPPVCKGFMELKAKSLTVVTPKFQSQLFSQRAAHRQAYKRSSIASSICAEDMAATAKFFMSGDLFLSIQLLHQSIHLSLGRSCFSIDLSMSVYVCLPISLVSPSLLCVQSSCPSFKPTQSNL